MKDPAVLFYIADWLTSTKSMRANARGWYLNLLLHQYQLGELPNDIEELALLADVRISEYEEFKQVFEQVLKHKFKHTLDGALVNPRMSDTLRKRESFIAQKSTSGRIGYVIKFCIAHVSKDRKFHAFIKEVLNLEDFNLKDKHLLEHVLKHLLKLYRNRNRNNKELYKEYINYDSIEGVDEQTPQDDSTHWRDDFNIYLEDAKKGFAAASENSNFIKEQSELNPGIDVIQTMRKMFVNYWGKEVGWKRKKASKTKNLDWDATIRTGLTYKENRVWLQK